MAVEIVVVYFPKQWELESRVLSLMQKHWSACSCLYWEIETHQPKFTQNNLKLLNDNSFLFAQNIESVWDRYLGATD